MGKTIPPPPTQQTENVLLEKDAICDIIMRKRHLMIRRAGWAFLNLSNNYLRVISSRWEELLLGNIFQFFNVIMVHYWQK